jgi:hypothetical protein
MTYDDEFNKVSELLRKGAAEEPQQILMRLIGRLSPEELRTHEVRIREVVPRFFPKRRAELEELLEKRLDPSAGKPATTDEARHAIDVRVTQRVNEFKSEIRLDLVELSDRHIFQWGTHYRDAIGRHYGHAVELAKGAAGLRDVSAALAVEYKRHSTEIHTKGFDYQSMHGDGHAPISKTLNGLQRFIELPIEAYTIRIGSARTAQEANLFRGITSAMLLGIIEGVGESRFDDLRGFELLARFPNSWVHYTAFFTADALDRTVAQLEHGVVRSGLSDTVVPVVRAIDRLLAPKTTHFLAPFLGQFSPSYGRLDVGLSAPTAPGATSFIDIQCYLDSSAVDRRHLEEAANRGVSVIVASLRPDMQDWVASHDLLAPCVVNPSATTGGTIELANERIIELLQIRSSRLFGRTASQTPIRANFATRFPLQNPFLTKYFHVQRPSIRNLVRKFEGRNGVRLWASLRRSGKTTACFDVGATSGGARVVAQSCADTEQFADATAFYDGVMALAESGASLPKSFVIDTVRRIQVGGEESAKLVFLLDEYERLFYRLRHLADTDPDKRYGIVQPLLDQLVAFSRENLLVFVGQRPDAHFILMEHNQLSAYVEQDEFPLFTISTSGAPSEFHVLARKVMTEHSELSDSFIAALYDETHGHPFLTVKVLVHFVDYLIERGWPSGKLIFSAEQFHEFRRTQLSQQSVARRQDYDFFRNAIADGLSSEGKRRDPWLFSVYRVLQRIARVGSGRYEIPRHQFLDLFDELRVNEETGYSAEEILSTGTGANFFRSDADTVGVRVRLLGRIAEVTSPRVRV